MMNGLSTLGEYDIVELVYILRMTLERQLQARCMFLDIIRDLTLNSGLDKVLMAHARYSKVKSYAPMGSRIAHLALKYTCHAFIVQRGYHIGRRSVQPASRHFTWYEVSHQYRRRA